MADSPPGISAAPKDDNLRHFDVSVAGPGQSPYEGGLQAFPTPRSDYKPLGDMIFRYRRVHRARYRKG